MNISFFIAFAAGIISVLSPCILPVIPSYLSYIGGIKPGADRELKNTKWFILLHTIFFVIGFTAVFTLMGVFFSGIGFAFSGGRRIINIVAGSIVIILGLNFIFNFWKILNFEKKFIFKNRPAGYSGSVLLGLAFGAGWSPCIGPILASILFLAGSTGTAAEGALLLITYSLGLGIPFLIFGFSASLMQKTIKKIRPKLGLIKRISGVFLILIGFLIASGQLSKLNSYVFLWGSSLRNWELGNPLIASLVYGSLFAAFSFLLLKSGIHKFIYNRNNNGGNWPIVRGVFAIIFLILSILSYSRTIELGFFLQKWLFFQGI